jgi:hypothetical protein
MVTKFFEELPILADRGRQVGVCAMGPVGEGDKVIWMRVWVWQQDGEHVAASAGNGGEQVPGAHPLRSETMPPFSHPEDKRWMVQTKLEPESAEFSDQKPAHVQATALVERDGLRSIVQWSQAVSISTPAHH